MAFYKSNTFIKNHFNSSRESTKEEKNKSEINNYLEFLNKEKLKMVEEGNYQEAHKLKLKIREIQNNKDSKDKRSLDNNFDYQLKQLKLDYEKELKLYEANCENNIKSLQEKEASEYDALALQHSNELKDLYKNIENMMKAMTLKHSGEYLEFRKMEQSLIKQQRYDEAHVVKVKADICAIVDEQNFKQEKENLIKTKVEKLVKKYQLEKKHLVDKFAYQIEMLKKENEETLMKINGQFKKKKERIERDHTVNNYLIQNTSACKVSKLNNFIFRKYQLKCKRQIKQINDS